MSPPGDPNTAGEQKWANDQQCFSIFRATRRSYECNLWAKCLWKEVVPWVTSPAGCNAFLILSPAPESPDGEQSDEPAGESVLRSLPFKSRQYPGSDGDGATPDPKQLCLQRENTRQGINLERAIVVLFTSAVVLPGVAFSNRLRGVG